MTKKFSKIISQIIASRITEKYRRHCHQKFSIYVNKMLKGNPNGVAERTLNETAEVPVLFYKFPGIFNEIDQWKSPEITETFPEISAKDFFKRIAIWISKGVSKLWRGFAYGLLKKFLKEL